MGKGTGKPCFSYREQGFVLFALASMQALTFDETKNPAKAGVRARPSGGTNVPFQGRD